MTDRHIKPQMVTFLLLLLLVLVGSFQAYCADWNPLSDTGQSSCYGDTWDATAIPCPAVDESLYGQDAQYNGLIPTYKDNGDGTVSDLNTGLMWQQNTADTDNSSTITVDDELNWDGAKSYCAGLSLATFDDWHLPEFSELVSIVDYGRSGPAIHPVFSEVAYPLYSRYWTATQSVTYTSYAWQIYFGDGSDEHNGKTLDYFVRCVREDI
jgi:Protein of unknown function (DUF1566)